MNKINRQYILYALCALSILALFLPLFNLEMWVEICGEREQGSVSITGFDALGVSYFAYALIICPVLLAVLDRIKPLEKYNKILSVAIPVIGLISLVVAYFQAQAYFEVAAAEEWLYFFDGWLDVDELLDYWYDDIDFGVNVSVKIGVIAVAISYIACAVLGAANNYGLKLDTINVNQIKDKIDVSQIKSVVEDGSEILKLKSSISDEERNIEQITKEIGKKYLLIHGDSAGAEFKELVISVKQSEQKIKEYRKQIQVIKGIKVCPHCGEELAANASFCNNCGAAVPKDGEELIECQNCKKMIPKDKKFCAYCGAKVELSKIAPAEEKRVCPNCGSLVEAGMMFCCDCGAHLNDVSAEAVAKPEVKRCPGCGAEIKEELAFCMECGHSLKDI